jgi:rod shape-determining protein MreD
LPGLIAGFSLGLIQDVYAYETLGSQMLANSVVGYGFGFFNDRVIKVMPAIRVILLAVAFAIHDFLAAISAGMKGDILLDVLIRHSLPSGVYTLVVGAGLFYLWSLFTSREA